MDVTVTRLLDCRNTVGESPVWDGENDRLLWCDIEGRTINALSMADSRVETWHLPGRVGSFGRCESGRLVIAMEDGIYLFDPASGTIGLLVKIDLPGPLSRLNDGKIGPDGAFWVGTMDERAQKEEIGFLYRVTPDGGVETKVSGLKTSNGVAFSADGRTLFHSDSRGPWIDRWALDLATGAISGRTRIRVLDDASGRPDGGACDIDGCYWSAGVTARRLNRFAPDGALLDTVAMPMAAPTMPCFGGADMKTVFVTGLRDGQSAEALAQYPDSGGIFAFRSPVAGVPVNKFRDL